MKGNFARFTLFSVAVCAVYFVLVFSLRPVMHPYFSDSKYYCVEALLLGVLLLGSWVLRGIFYKWPLIYCGALGFMVESVAYVIKWLVLEGGHGTGGIGDVLQDVAVMPIFSYRWLILPAAFGIVRYCAKKRGVNFPELAASGSP